MNNARIRNDLGTLSKSNLSNFEKAKLGACALGTVDDDCSEGILLHHPRVFD